MPGHPHVGKGRKDHIPALMDRGGELVETESDLFRYRSLLSELGGRVEVQRMMSSLAFTVLAEVSVGLGIATPSAACRTN